jgi:hypothetical protein
VNPEITDTFGNVLHKGARVVAMTGVEQFTRLVRGEVLRFSKDSKKAKIRIIQTPNNARRKDLELDSEIWIHVHRSAWTV